MTDGAPAPGPRVVLLRMNHLSGDSRAQKPAQSLAEAGWDVHVLGRSRTAARESTSAGGVTVTRVPVRMEIAPYRFRTWRRGLFGRIGFRTPEDERADRLTVGFRRRLLALDLVPDRSDGRHRGRRLVRRAGVFASRARHRLRRDATRRHAARLADTGRWTSGLRAWFFVRAARGAAWRRTQPHLADFDTAFAPVVDELAPDVIHAQDVTALGLAVRAATRLAKRTGRRPAVVYDAQEFIPGAGYADPERHAAYIALECDYIRRVDAVVTVSETLARMLHERHRLPVRPTVVTNAPYLIQALDRGGPGPSVRRAAGLGDDVPILVYSGWIAPERGVATLLEALTFLPEVHVVLVVGDRRPYLAELEALAARLGVAGRVHQVPYVNPAQVVAYLSSATVGVVPLLHLPNHEISLITKYYEYMHARLPLVVSDVETMGAFTRELGNGEVFRAGDARGLADAVTAVLGDRARYTVLYERPGLLAEHSWQAQGHRLNELYARLTGLEPQVKPRPGDDAPSGSAGAGAVERIRDPATPGVRSGPFETAVSTMPGFGPRPLRVVLPVAEPARTAQVRTVAEAAAAAGWDVVMLTPAGTAAQACSRREVTGVQVVEIPWVREAQQHDRRVRRRGLLGRIGYRDPSDERGARLEYAFRRNDGAAEQDWITARLAGRTGRVPHAGHRTVLPIRALQNLLGMRAVQVRYRIRRQATRRHALWLDHPPALVTAVRNRLAGLPGTPVGPRALPYLVDADAALGPVLDDLRPDLVHTCDPAGLVVALLAAERVRQARGERVFPVVHGLPGIDTEAPVPGDGTGGADPGGGTDPAVGVALERAAARYLPRCQAVVAGRPWGSEAVREVYEKLTGERPQPSPQPSPQASAGSASSPGSRAACLVIGPHNMAGQGWAWARAVERFLPGVRAEAYALRRDSPFVFPSDHDITAEQWASLDWHLALRRRLRAGSTHVLCEGVSALTGRAAGTFTAEARALAEAGITVGMVLHGSDIRDPRRHRALYPDSPFSDPNDKFTGELQVRRDRRARALAGWAGPAFVSTLDLLDFVADITPHARWLPVAVDTTVWKPGREPLSGAARPVVLHAPSRGVLKGSAVVDAVCRRLEDEGLIVYRRLDGVPPRDMPQALAEADIVVDQIVMGDVGVLAAQAMAAGRLVVGNVAPGVRARLPFDRPVAQACPATLEQTLRSVLDDRVAARAVAAAGPEFVRRYHDGAYAADVLAEFLTGAE